MGKILTDSKRLNIAIILLLINCVLVLMMGLLYAISGTFMAYHVAFTGKTASQVSSYDSELMFLISAFIRLIGFYLIAIAVFSIYIIIHGIKEKEKWAWFCVLFVYLIAVIPTIVITYMITGLLGTPFLITVVLIILWIIALTYSYKEIF
jgi:hypothetical protein